MRTTRELSRSQRAELVMSLEHTLGRIKRTLRTLRSVSLRRAERSPLERVAHTQGRTKPA